MRCSFYVPADKFTEAKAIIRRFPSLRFEGNPLGFNKTVNITLTGEVEEMNAMHVQLDALLNPELPEPKGNSPNIFTKIVALVKKPFSNRQQ